MMHITVIGNLDEKDEDVIATTMQIAISPFEDEDLTISIGKTGAFDRIVGEWVTGSHYLCRVFKPDFKMRRKKGNLAFLLFKTHLMAEIDLLVGVRLPVSDSRVKYARLHQVPIVLIDEGGDQLRINWDNLPTRPNPE